MKECFECKILIDGLNTPSSQSKEEKERGGKSECIKCKNTFHISCFNTRKKAILCKSCDFKVNSNNTFLIENQYKNCLLDSIPKNEKTLLDFFSISTKIKIKQQILKIEENNLPNKNRLSSPLKPKEIKNGKKKCINIRKKKPLFKLPKLTEDPNQRLLQKQSLAYGLLSKNITFDDDLCFSNTLCPPSKNDALFESNLQVVL